MADSLSGRIAIVTAGGAGIGAATARRFAEEGASVVVADLSGRRAGAIAAAITSGGGRAVSIKMDAAEPEGIQAAIRLALDTFGRLDILFNNAGMADVALLEETSLESWNRVIAVTLTGTFLGMKYALPVMRRQGRGVIVNTASISGTAGDYGLSSYNAAKAGVINLTRAAAIENARHNTHEGHLTYLNELDRPVVSGEIVKAFTFTGEAEALRQRVRELAARGVTEIAYQPKGPDIARELTAFAAMAGLG
jgi:meso-butanediol dehydrogenase/(S,S)-butanediol dehydrogenase/diacetyl reductase